MVQQQIGFGTIILKTTTLKPLFESLCYKLYRDKMINNLEVCLSWLRRGQTHQMTTQES